MDEGSVSASVPGENSETDEINLVAEAKVLPARRSSRRKRSQDRRAKENGITMPAVITLNLIAHRSTALQLGQLNMLIAQLGYVPYNLVEIGASSHDAEPVTQVAKLYPLNKCDSSGRYMERHLPFPTMFWLCCPELHTKICELEVEGWVVKLQKRLTESDERDSYLAAMESAHRQYAAERWELLSDADKDLIIKNGWLDSLKHSGVAGMKVFSGVKCLHTHYAHHLARPEHGNIIGVWVHELLLLKEQDVAAAAAAV